ELTGGTSSNTGNLNTNGTGTGTIVDSYNDGYLSNVRNSLSGSQSNGLRPTGPGNVTAIDTSRRLCFNDLVCCRIDSDVIDSSCACRKSCRRHGVNDIGCRIDVSEISNTSRISRS